MHYAGVEALKGINIEMGDSDNCIALIGCNGAGKSTFVNAITGLVDWDGEIIYKGESLKGYTCQKLVKKGIVQCPERRFLFDYLPIKDNLLLGAYNAGRNPRIKIDYVFELFPVLQERLKQQVYSLSGGEAQMVAIGRSLLADPELLILDEPTLGLAPIIRKKLIEAFNNIKETTGIKIILVEQNVTVSFDVAETIHCIREGHIVKVGTPEELKADEEIYHTFLGV